MGIRQIYVLSLFFLKYIGNPGQINMQEVQEESMPNGKVEV